MSWERIKELFHEALALAEEERRALLDGVDVEIRREVELLLEAHVESPREEDQGAMIGRYKILQQIGEGGFGVVHMAEQMEPVRRKVALKIIKLGMDSKQIVARFEAERQALALMDHPNIAQVFDGGVTSSGRPYFVMELVKGVPITEYCNGRALGMRERLELFQAVCHAVQHAHQKGVIHRDLKPSNVLVTLHDGIPVPKVIDFGVAKATGSRLTDKTLFTEFKTMVGTPEYMAPEQAELGGLDVDTRADIYSLGVLLYELLTGTKPFDLVRKGYEEILRTIREDDPPKPSTRASTVTGTARSQASLRTIGRELRGDLDWIVMKALEKSRERRYETANAFAADIGRYLADELVSASPPGAAYRFKKYVRRNRALVVGALAVFAALAIGLVIAYVNYREAEHARGLEAERAREARTEADKARTTVELLDELLGGAARAKQGPNYPLRKALLDFDARVLERLEDQPEVEAQLRLTLTRGYLSVSALDHVEKQLEALRPLAGVFSALQRAKFHSYDAQHLRALDRNEDALAADQRALVEYEKVPGVDKNDVALVQVELAEDYMNLRRYAEAEEAAKRSIATYELAGYEAGKRFGWDQLSRIYQRQNKLALAEQYARRALEASRAAGFVLPADEHSWACLLAAKGDYAAATKAAQRALDTETELRGPGTILGAQVMRTLALTAHRQGDLPRARKLAEKALAVALTTVEARGSRIANYHSALGGVALSQRDLVLAEKCVRAAIAALERFGKADTPAAATQFGNLGLLLTKKGEYAEADRVLTRAAAAARKHRDLTGLESALRKHAGVLMHLERPAEGERLAREAVDLARSRGIDHPDVIYSLGALTQTLMAQRKWEEAEQAAAEVLAVVQRKFGSDAPMLPDVLTQLGSIALWRKNYEMASRRHKEAYVAYRRRLPAKHPKVSTALRQLIESSIMAKRWSLVARAAEDELKLSVAPRHESLELLARGLSGQEKHAAAEKVWRLCHDLRAKATPDNWTRYRAMSYLGACLLAQDKLDEAEPLLIEAYEKMKPAPTDAADKLAARDRVVALYEKRGMPDKAADWRKRTD